MKNKTGLLSALFCSIILVGLVGCGAKNQEKIIGTWDGDGTVDVLGANMPFEFAETLTFTANGTAFADIPTKEGVLSSVEFKYSLTDDTLTFTKDDVGMGIGYTLKGDTLTIETSGETSAIFTRVEQE